MGGCGHKVAVGTPCSYCWQPQQVLATLARQGRPHYSRAICFLQGPGAASSLWSGTPEAAQWVPFSCRPLQ